jgi:hypothetical protein
LLVNDIPVIQWKADQDLGSDSAVASILTSKHIPRVWLNAEDNLIIRAQGDGTEFARLDRLTLTPSEEIPILSCQVEYTQWDFADGTFSAAIQLTVDSDSPVDSTLVWEFPAGQQLRDGPYSSTDCGIRADLLTGVNAVVVPNACFSDNQTTFFFNGQYDNPIAQPQSFSRNAGDCTLSVFPTEQIPIPINVNLAEDVEPLTAGYYRTLQAAIEVDTTKRFGYLAQNATLQILARSPDGRFLYFLYQLTSVRAWVSAEYISLPDDIVIWQIPIRQE